MKLLMRISAILAAALIVVGLAFGLSKTSYVQTMVPSRSFERQLPATTMTTVDSAQTSTDTTSETGQAVTPSPAQPEFERDHEEPSGLFGLLQVVQNLGIMSLIVLPFALWPWLTQRSKTSTVVSSHSAG